MSQTTPPTVDALPTAPSASVPIGFALTMDNFLAALGTYRTQLIALGTNAYNNAVDCWNSAVAAAASAASALGYSNNAAASAASALASANTIPWVTGTTYVLGVNVSSPTNGHSYRKITASSVSSTDPVSDPINWLDLMLTTIGRSQRTSNSILVVSDRGSLVEYTAGAFTQTFTSAATLGAGWYCYLKNSGSGDITIPSSDGVTNWIVYPGECRLFLCDGTVFTSIVIHPFIRKYTSSGNFIKPPGYSYFGGNLWSAGGSGGYYSSGGAPGGGGGGGACLQFILASSFFGASEAVTIGAGGAPQTVAETPGNTGGNSTIGTSPFLSATGGGGGGANQGAGSGVSGSVFVSSYSQASASNGFAGVLPGNSSIFGGGSGGAYNTNTGNGQNGGQSMWGGGGGGGSPVSGTVVGSGGVSLYAGSGGAGAKTGTAGNGIAPAGGGGGAYVAGGATASGAGARGEAHIWGVV